ncbi:MAG TPA: lysylphosphatidylglycerol synthase transmembrane domain-containing protein [Vicinamibacteria bacterium]|nr:lysylphosphatidylglycerol synthase transmembrane domain-containing protein [Vicinamibacteria bacterium]
MKKTGLLALKIGVSLALLAYLLSTSNLSDLRDRVRHSDTVLMGLAVVLYSLILILSTWRWRLLLKAQGYEAPMGQLSASYLVATFFNNFLPSNIGGDVIRVKDTSPLTGCTTTSLAVVAIDRIIGLGALYLLAAVAFVLGGSALHLLGAAPALFLLTLVFAMLAYVFFKPGTARRLMAASGLGKHAWAQERFEIVQGAVHIYRARMAAVWGAFGASLALQALVVCYYFEVARALRIPIPLSACFLVIPLCSLLQTVPISFNGWGIRESVFIVYFGQLGLPRESALAFSLVGASLIVVLSLSGAVVWTTRGVGPQAA